MLHHACICHHPSFATSHQHAWHYAHLAGQRRGLGGAHAALCCGARAATDGEEGRRHLRTQSANSACAKPWTAGAPRARHKNRSRAARAKCTPSRRRKCAQRRSSLHPACASLVVVHRNSTPSSYPAPKQLYTPQKHSNTPLTTQHRSMGPATAHMPSSSASSAAPLRTRGRRRCAPRSRTRAREL
jgi:hypothetical protein